MDHDRKTEQGRELDQLMDRASASLRNALDAAVDVRRRLRDLLSEADIAPK